MWASKKQPIPETQAFEYLDDLDKNSKVSKPRGLIAATQAYGLGDENDFPENSEDLRIPDTIPDTMEVRFIISKRKGLPVVLIIFDDLQKNYAVLIFLWFKSAEMSDFL